MAQLLPFRVPAIPSVEPALAPGPRIASLERQLAAARAEAAAAYAAGMADGRSAAEIAAVEALSRQVADLASPLALIVGTLEDERRRIVAEAATLALAIGEAIAGVSAEGTLAAAQAVVVEAIEAAVTRAKLTLRLPIGQSEAVRQALQPIVPASLELHVMEDAALHAGDCIAQGEFGRVEHLRAERLDAIRQGVGALVAQGAA